MWIAGFGINAKKTIGQDKQDKAGLNFLLSLMERRKK